MLRTCGWLMYLAQCIIGSDDAPLVDGVRLQAEQAQLPAHEQLVQLAVGANLACLAQVRSTAAALPCLHRSSTTSSGLSQPSGTWTWTGTSYQALALVMAAANTLF